MEKEKDLRVKLITELDRLYDTQAALKQQLLVMDAYVIKPNVETDCKEQDKPENSVNTFDYITGVEKAQSFLSPAYEEKQAVMEAEASTTQWEQLKNSIQEYSDGPYGDYNERVNTITKKLDLNDNQASYYHTLLEDYEEQANALYEGMRFPKLSSAYDLDNFQILLEEAELEKQALDEIFDQEFIHVLTPEQAKAYEQLPLGERGVGPNAGLDRLEFVFSDLSELAIEY